MTTAKSTIRVAASAAHEDTVHTWDEPMPLYWSHRGKTNAVQALRWTVKAVQQRSTAREMEGHLLRQLQ
ncbi:hypothetical protein JG687_00015096 [Phytophthora cactorum]|uniref:Uncharacterized protein n=1 Tax=Phytophthora cactorum TaxID=29920 RepID=A0A8T1TZT4_9STRA|nr:hypothetical protein JG687_00015096 [Phytophthora cactorum]